MSFGNIFGRRRSSNAVDGMMAIQKMKNLGTTEMLSMSQIVNLITNLPDAQRNLDNTHFRFVYAVFKVYRKQRDLRPMNMDDYIRACKLIIDTYEDEVPYLLLDGKYSENLSEQAIADVWFLYNSGMRCDEMLPLAERSKMGAMASQMRQKSQKQDGAVNIFHVARRPDGTIEPVISAKIPPNDTKLIRSLLRSDEVGVDTVTLDDTDSYYFLYNKLLTLPYSDVMIMKCKRTAQGVLYIDIGQQDTKAITYAMSHYLSNDAGQSTAEAYSASTAEKNISYCHKCGNRLVDGSVFCNKCGARIPCAEAAQGG